MMALSARDSKILWSRSHGVCAFPQCRHPLVEAQQDATTGESFDAVVGEEAHVHSPQPGGPRYDPDYPVEKLETYENRILLCPSYHTLIDKDGGRAFTAETVFEMKASHETQQKRIQRRSEALSKYVADRAAHDDHVKFRQVELDGPRVDSMFVDVPFACRAASDVAPLLERISEERPGDVPPPPGFLVTGAAQALLHPDWRGNALIIGGPGQGKSTLLQYVCQFYRARMLKTEDYTGMAQGLKPLTSITRVPIRIDLREYAAWATQHPSGSGGRKGGRSRQVSDWPPLEVYLADQIHKHSGGIKFKVEDLGAMVRDQAVILAFDGLDEVSSLTHRDRVSKEIVATHTRLSSDAYDLSIVVATRPGASTSSLWSSAAFPQLYLQKLSPGLRLQYLDRWTTVTGLASEAAERLRQTFVEHEASSHIRDLASYPMQLAILLHLLYRRGLLPQQRTQLYQQYVQAFLDREHSEGKEPLLSNQRDVVEDAHAFLGWMLQSEAEREEGSGRIARDELRQSLRNHLEGRPKSQELADALFSAMESRVLCLVEREPGFFEFEVQSLREYFAAKYVFDYSPSQGTGNSRSDCFEAMLIRPSWLNVCRFLVGMFNRMEVSGIHHSLHRAAASDKCLALHPHLRTAAARFLDDRAYQNQRDDPIREVVDFVLNGPGVVLADDGFLDDASQPLTFSDDAGRQQALEHLQQRIGAANTEIERAALARMILRHANEPTEIRQWWWGQIATDPQWLHTAAHLGVLDAPRSVPDSFVDAIRAADSPTHWASELLELGGYAQNQDSVLSICKRDLNDGASEVLEPVGATPLAQIAAAAQLVKRQTPAASQCGGARGRRRTGREVLAEISEGCVELLALAGPADSAYWTERTKIVHRVWGDGWVLRQAIASVPRQVDLGWSLSVPAIELEAQRRAHRDDPAFWRADLTNCGSVFERRCWLFAALTIPHAATVVGMADDINAVVSEFAPKHHRSTRAALASFARLGPHQPLVLNDELRLNKVSLSPQALWLVRQVATEETRNQIDTKLAKSYVELIEADASGLHDLLTGTRTKIKVDTLLGTRADLPPGIWEAGANLGVISATLSSTILETPHNWPSAVVARAIRQQAQPLSAASALAEVADRDRWFQP